MKQLFTDKMILFAVAVLILCLIGIGCVIYSVANPQPNEPVVYSLGTLMKHSFRTKIEQKAGDGTIKSVVISGDPVFNDSFNIEDENYMALDIEVDTRQWLFRVTYWDDWEMYNYATGGEIVFLIGDGWFVLNREEGTVLTMNDMDSFLESLNKTFSEKQAILDKTN